MVTVNRRPIKRDDLVNADAQMTIDCEAQKGDWTKLESPLKIGDVVRVDKGFLSGDSFRVELAPGNTGIVEEIDEDGDAQIRFPGLKQVRCRLRWVLKDGFCKLLRIDRKGTDTGEDDATSAEAR